MEMLPTQRGTTLPAEMSPGEVLRQFENLEAIVSEQRRLRDGQEARDRDARSRTLEDEARRYRIWNEGAHAGKRAQERLALQEKHSACVQALDRAEDAEQQQLQAEYNRKRAECHAKHNERRAELGRKIEAEQAALLSRQQAEFNPQTELIAGWEAARRRKIADLERDGGSRSRMNEALAEWQEFNPKPSGHGLGR